MASNGKMAGKKVVVTGSGTGVGRGIALEMAREGADVVLHYSRSADGAVSAVDEITKAGGKAVAFQADDYATQIFIVNDAARVKISTKTPAGTAWDEQWHDVKIVRKIDSGLIEIYWDDMRVPVRMATDKTFAWGQVGLGSFDDTGNRDDFRLHGITVRPDE